METVPKPKRYYLLTVPRCASNLLQRILSSQPGVEHSSYHLFKAWLTTPMEEWYNNGRQLDSLSAEERSELDANFQAAYEKTLEVLDSAESSGQAVFIKEHVLTMTDLLNVWKTHYPKDAGPALTVNEPEKKAAGRETAQRTSITFLPDDLLLSLTPIFQIRHPLLTFPSALRAMRDTSTPDQQRNGPFEDNLQTYRWSRQLYEWYVEHSVTPAVIDADDVMLDDGSAVKRLCKATGLDPDHLLFQWETKTATTPIGIRFLSTLYASTGIVKGLTATNLSIESERGKWLAEFGLEWTESLIRRVELAMADYDWLKARCV